MLRSLVSLITFSNRLHEAALPQRLVKDYARGNTFASKGFIAYLTVDINLAKQYLNPSSPYLPTSGLPTSGLHIVFDEVFATQARANIALQEAIDILEPLDLNPTKHFAPYDKENNVNREMMPYGISLRDNAIQYRLFFSALSKNALSMLSHAHRIDDFEQMMSLTYAFFAVYRNTAYLLQDNVYHPSDDAEQDLKKYLALMGVSPATIVKVPHYTSEPRASQLEEFFKLRYPRVIYDVQEADRSSVYDLLGNSVPAWMKTTHHISISRVHDVGSWVYTAPSGTIFTAGPYKLNTPAYTEGKPAFISLLNILGYGVDSDKIKFLNGYEPRDMSPKTVINRISDPYRMIDYILSKP